jgi:hypothetical protein
MPDPPCLPLVAPLQCPMPTLSICPPPGHLPCPLAHAARRPIRSALAALGYPPPAHIPSHLSRSPPLSSSSAPSCNSSPLLPGLLPSSSPSPPAAPPRPPSSPTTGNLLPRQISLPPASPSPRRTSRVSSTRGWESSGPPATRRPFSELPLSHARIFFLVVRSAPNSRHGPPVPLRPFRRTCPPRTLAHNTMPSPVSTPPACVPSPS